MTTQQTPPPDPSQPAATPPAQPPADPPAQNEPATQASEPSEEQKKLANEQLRAWAQQTADENKQLKGLAMRSALGEIGLDPTEGLGLAIVESFDGQITDEAVANFAAEKYKYGAQQQPAQVVDPAVAAAERAAQMQQQGQPVVPIAQPSKGQEATAKIEENDPEAGRSEALMSINEKANQFMGQHYPQQQ